MVGIMEKEEEGLQEKNLTISLVITCLIMIVITDMVMIGIVQAMDIMEISMDRKNGTMVKTLGSKRKMVFNRTSMNPTAQTRSENMVPGTILSLILAALTTQTIEIRVLDDLSGMGVEDLGKTFPETRIETSKSKEVLETMRLKAHRENSLLLRKKMFSTQGKLIKSSPRSTARDQDKAVLVTRIQT